MPDLKRKVNILFYLQKCKYQAGQYFCLGITRTYLIIVNDVSSSFLDITGNAKTYKAWCVTKRAGHSVAQMKRLKAQELNGNYGNIVI